MKQVPLLESALSRVGGNNPLLRQFVYALGAQESGFNPNAVGPKTGSGDKAQGMLQVMPGTFKGLQKQFPGLLKDIKNPEDLATAGVLYAQEAMKFAKDDPKIAGAYFYGGPGGAKKALAGVPVFDPVNKGFPNTLEYGDKIAQRMQAMGGSWTAGPVVPPVVGAVPNVAPVMAQAAPANVPVIAPMAQDVPLIQQQLAQLPAPTMLGSNEPKKVTPNDIDFMGQIFGNKKPVDFSPFMLGMSDKANIGGFGGRKS